jgi:hypothetical protein
MNIDLFPFSTRVYVSLTDWGVRRLAKPPRTSSCHG